MTEKPQSLMQSWDVFPPFLVWQGEDGKLPIPGRPRVWARRWDGLVYLLRRTDADPFEEVAPTKRARKITTLYLFDPAIGIMDRDMVGQPTSVGTSEFQANTMRQKAWAHGVWQAVLGRRPSSYDRYMRTVEQLRRKRKLILDDIEGYREAIAKMGPSPDTGKKRVKLRRMQMNRDKSVDLLPQIDLILDDHNNMTSLLFPSIHASPR